MAVLLEKYNTFPEARPSFFNCRRIAINGVIPAPPAMKYPGPLYSMAPQTSRRINSSPATS